jgi:hypothetical protein
MNFYAHPFSLSHWKIGSASSLVWFLQILLRLPIYPNKYTIISSSPMPSVEEETHNKKLA